VEKLICCIIVKKLIKLQVIEKNVTIFYFSLNKLNIFRFCTSYLKISFE